MKFCSFLFILCSFCLVTVVSAQEAPPPATAIMQEAYQKAAKDHKNVFVLFTASWCRQCHKMDSAMNNPACRKLFNDNYVICHLTVFESKDEIGLENPGAVDLMKQYHGDKRNIPFWLIFDSTGVLLADSQIRPAGVGLDVAGVNIGCPTKKEEVAFFIKELKNTSSLTPESQAVIAKVFSHIK